jgi:hypothetical protein
VTCIQGTGIRQSFEWAGATLTLEILRDLEELTRDLTQETVIHVAVAPRNNAPGDPGGEITIKITGGVY